MKFVFSIYLHLDAPRSWIYQTSIYIGLMVLIKLLTTLVIQFDFWDSVKDLVLMPFSNSTIELIVIMLVIPFFVNLIMFWVTDNFLMRHEHLKTKSFLINYVDKKCSRNNSVAHLNGKSINNTTHKRTNYLYLNPINNNHSFMNSFDSEIDALISGDEHGSIDDVEIYDQRTLDS